MRAGRDRAPRGTSWREQGAAGCAGWRYGAGEGWSKVDEAGEGAKADWTGCAVRPLDASL